MIDEIQELEKSRIKHGIGFRQLCREAGRHQSTWLRARRGADCKGSTIKVFRDALARLIQST
jgi:predicted transcriptional regulator